MCFTPVSFGLTWVVSSLYTYLQFFFFQRYATRLSDKQRRNEEILRICTSFFYLVSAHCVHKQIENEIRVIWNKNYYAVETQRAGWNKSKIDRQKFNVRRLSDKEENKEEREAIRDYVHRTAFAVFTREYLRWNALAPPKRTLDSVTVSRCELIER